MTTTDIHTLRCERQPGIEGRVAKGTPQATSSERQGWRARAVIISPGLLLRKLGPVLDTSQELPAYITQRHTSWRSSHVSEEQLPLSGPTCQLVNRLNTV
ncbi:Hypothetical predicted protein [Scomber scombrus]|uniref:Uncharacterized protein n=1 Tax=Scomber scombrus TaxID=13677 RepID=A0AAV1PC71_SCOSC